MPLVQWFRARSLSTSVVLGLLTPVGAAVAQPDPAQAVVAPVALPAVTSDTASVPAPSAVSAPLPTDSVHLIALLLTTNGASRERAGPAAAAIMKYARLHALDPLLVVGVIGVENASLKPRALPLKSRRYGTPVRIEVSVARVPGEEKVDNNRQSYTAIFTR